jgi:hypothetical protein
MLRGLASCPLSGAAGRMIAPDNSVPVAARHARFGTGDDVPVYEFIIGLA